MAKVLFIVAGLSLVLAGVLHLSSFFTNPLDPNALVPVVILGLLALAYLAIGIMLLLRKESMLMAGMIVPVVGLVLALAFAASSPLLVAFIALDIVAAAINAFLYSQTRSTIRRVR